MRWYTLAASVVLVALGASAISHYSSPGVSSCGHWTRQNLHNLTIAAMNQGMGRGPEFGQARVVTSELPSDPNEVSYNGTQHGWLASYEIKRNGTNVGTMFSMISCSGHVEFGKDR
jgi:hypothetical protein